MLQGTDTTWQNFSPNILEKSPFWFTIIVLLVSIIIARFAPRKRKSIPGSLFPFGLYLLLLLAGVIFEARGHLALADYSRLAAVVMVCISFINLASLLIFDVALSSLHLTIPRILRDTAIILVYVIATLALLSSRGVNITSLLTTSAIITAVIGLSLQDTLGNIIAGFALQLEHIVQPGDWIKLEPYIGRVKEIRWRQTSIETRNWETVLIPNSQIMKGQVMIYGRRHNEPLQTRRWVYFNVSYQHAPSEVIAVVNEALQAAPLENVAAEPKIHTILLDFKEGTCLYAVRYWLTNIAVDDPTDSMVRIRIYFALKRAGISLAIPTHNINVTEESNKRQLRRQEEELNHRLEALKSVELFHTMTEEELREMANHLRYAPFSRGEVLTRQGADAHWLYIITHGRVSVRIRLPEYDKDKPIEKEISQLVTGNFFGEISLMTGEKRTATVVALEDTECYRLDKEGFQKFLTARPEIAKDISHVLARRRVELYQAMEGLDHHEGQKRISATQDHILDSIKQFFGLSR